MKKREHVEELEVLSVLQSFGNIATTTQINARMKLLKMNYDSRPILRKLKRKGLLKTDRPFDNSLELRWEVVSKEKL